MDTLINNRYQLGALLGRGGMGAIYRAHDTFLERDVAVKLLDETGLGTEGRSRLLNEARAAAQLNHPNIVSIYDAGEQNGAPYIVMELVEGRVAVRLAPAEDGARSSASPSRSALRWSTPTAPGSCTAI